MHWIKQNVFTRKCKYLYSLEKPQRQTIPYLWLDYFSYFRNWKRILNQLYLWELQLTGNISARNHLVTQTFQIDLKQPCYLMVSSYNERLMVASIDTHLIWYILWWNGFQKRWEILSPLEHIACTAFKNFQNR